MFGKLASSQIARWLTSVVAVLLMLLGGCSKESTPESGSTDTVASGEEAPAPTTEPAEDPAPPSLDAQIEESNRTIWDARDAADYDRALQLAQEQLEMVQNHEDGAPYHEFDARWVVRALEHIDTLPVEAQAELARTHSIAREDSLKALWGQGELDKVADYADERLRTLRKYFDTETPETAVALAYVFVSFQTRAHFTAADSVYSLLEPVVAEVFDIPHPSIFMSAELAARARADLGDNVRAEAVFRRCLLAARGLSTDPEDMARILTSLAGTLMAQGKYVQAIELLEESVELSRQRNQDLHVAISLSALASALIEMGAAERAESTMLQVLEIFSGRDETASDLSRVADFRTRLGRALGLQDREQEAEEQFRQALAIREKLGQADSGRAVDILNELGNCLRRRGNVDDAEKLHQRALAAAQRSHGNQHLKVVETRYLLARCLLDRGDSRSAEQLLAEAASDYEVARARAGTGISRATARQRSPYDALAAARLELGDPAGAWPATERGRARALSDLLDASGNQSMTSEERDRMVELRKSLSSLLKKIDAIETGETVDTVLLEENRDRLRATEAEWSELQADLASKYRTGASSYALAQIQSQIPNDTALIGWLDQEYGGRHRAWGYVVKSSGPVQWVELPSATEDIALAQAGELVAEFRGHVANSGASILGARVTPELRESGQQMFEQRFGPLMPLLTGIENLVVIPSGPMLGIPVEPMVDEDGRYLVERFGVTYAPSATIYTWLREKASTAEIDWDRALVLGDPPFNERHGQKQSDEEDRLRSSVESAPKDDLVIPIDRLRESWTRETLQNLSRLRWSQDEAKEVSAVFGESTLLTGRRASEPELIALADAEELSSYSTIHLATHALVDDDRPQRSALVLSQLDLPDAYEAAKNNQPIYDGVLTASEIVQRFELDADLVTLSACETGLGKRVPGEGYIGLAHAFFQAGARNVMVSLWKVDDKATSILMGRFYRALTEEGKTQSAALSEAKKALIEYEDEKGRRRYEHPFYWAAFVLMGGG